MRLASLLPSATEILYALGLGDQIMGVSHECDHPPDALTKPRVIRTIVDQERLSSGAIDQAVRTAVQQHHGLYAVDVEALSAAQPDLVVAQSLCEVCAVGEPEVHEAIRALSPKPAIVTLHPHTIEEVLTDIRRLGHATNRNREASRLVAALTKRIERVETLVRSIARRPAVFCLEWLDPPMAAGHWVPEMVSLAGGREVLGRAGAPSRYVTWNEVVAAQPEVLVLMPCGFPIERTRRELPLLTGQPWWADLPAVRERRVFLVNGPAYFNRPGPRLIDGIELLAGLFHPDHCARQLPPDAMEPLDYNR